MVELLAVLFSVAELSILVLCVFELLVLLLLVHLVVGPTVVGC